MVDYLPLAKVLVEVLVAIVGIVFSYVLLPVVRDTLVPWLREKRILNLVSQFVQAAEKLAETGVIDKDYKKSYVVGLLEQKGIVVTPIIDAFVESAVLDLDKAFADGFDIIMDEIVGAEADEENKE